MEETYEVELAKAVGFGDLTFFSKVGFGGGSCVTVAHLAAIAVGQATVGVAWRSRKRGSGPRPWTNTAVQLPTPAQWTRPVRPAAPRRRDSHARPPPHARVRHDPRPPLQRRPRLPQPGQPEPGGDHVRPPADPRDVHDRPVDQRAPLPLRQLPGDGRGAELRDRAGGAGARLPPGPVYVHSAAQGLPAQHHSMVNYWNEDPLTGPAWAAARHLWKHADFTPHDVDVAQIYDAFTEGGALETGGRLPLNTGGGGLSEAYVHGFNLINEGVMQLRGTSTAQVPGAATCLVTAGEGVRPPPSS